ncbi:MULTISPECIES: peptidoglycan DD-metalloendopeptidase family protein [Acinetobacter]|uniref:LysM peptidoglycan-binding domain-containing protein n=2 Tax=Acinetobacter TaxID=469 RepID=A0A4Q7AQ99_9GAMM|nr:MULTISPECIES: peptidoglycan DD-metalloendopeptidase family protein [Acinetobacter]MCW8040776.1 peptidoglycan DD-metalloendopeptidase family protein [Acinetobacter entericus]RZG64214.1 LysM peptidoglycan-binding domain-containing protein [Acinetobacter bouvetii]TCB73895.1 LysM peptidoglycan-binding domain-containing protein [Acinetobacter sp. ANC 4177]
MSLASQYRLKAAPAAFIKSLVFSLAAVSTVILSGCASKPQVSNATRYAAAPDFYTVRSGDTLSGIAGRYGLSYISVAEMNDIAPPYRIYVGQSIRLKNSASRRAASTQAMTQSAPIQRQTVPLPQNTVPAAPAVSAQNQTAPAVRAQSSSLRWVKPSNGSVIAKFNLASNVKGVRFGGKAGDPIYAAADGQVVYAADGLKEYGNLILLKHINGYITAYAHNSKMIVKSGDNVQAGQKIAEMGSTGTSGTMLEFQVRLDGKPVNPEMVLPLN